MSAPWNHNESGQPDAGAGAGGASRLPKLAPPAVNLQVKREHEQQHHVILPSISTISSAGGSNSSGGVGIGASGGQFPQSQGQGYGQGHAQGQNQQHSMANGGLPGALPPVDHGSSALPMNNLNGAITQNGTVQVPGSSDMSPNDRNSGSGSTVQNLSQDVQESQQLMQQPQEQSLENDAVATGGQDSNYRPLNVKDALSYLEQVKFQFSSRPDVYNHFLDIMKDFKSQAIDTPGVIQRVTTLFQGFPNLIQGFNTFLPHGYKIECSSNPNDPIRVTTPFGSIGEVSVMPSEQRIAVSLPSSEVKLSEPLSQAVPQLMSNGHAQQNHSVDQVQPQPTQQLEQQTQSQNQAQPQQSLQHPDTQPQQPGSQQYGGPNYMVPNPEMIGVIPGQQKTGEVEFSHAISYVNKIKTRFADQPDIYKQFLEILQTYQREQKPINEVYAQVTILFQHNPDLLDDFKKFLPDSSVQPQQQLSQALPQGNQQGILPSNPYLPQSHGIQGQRFYPQSSVPLPQTNLPPLGNFSASGQASPADNVNLLPSMQHHIPGTQPALQHIVTQGMSNQDIPVSDLRSTMNGTYDQQAEYIQQGHVYAQPAESTHYMEGPIARPEIDLDPSLVPVVPEPLQPPEDAVALSDEVTFFDRVKRFISNKQVYAEFLKVLNLYSQDLLSTGELVSKVEYYLHGSKELFDWFKVFVGYVEKPKHIENIVHEKHKLDLDLCEACGPSYKKLPKDDTFMPCSGRDEMCWEVLNDEWVGHPVWASEDSGFIAHRKNQYEDTLFKVEEERHEYDFYIESNLRTIQTLETIANKIANMTNDEKNNFKLPPGLGHTSLTIYKKVIRKVYDKDRGFDIIDALHEHPAVTVPIVLKRLKQKDEEWRRAQREWNKVWRELEQKVFYKSLDHLGLTFKQADKKLLTTKQLLSEISSIKVDQTNKRIHPLTPRPKSQLDFNISDSHVLYDILDLAFTFVNINSTYSSSDKTKIQQFLKGFLSLFFSFSIDEIQQAMAERQFDGHQEPVQEDRALNNEKENPKKRPLSDEESFMMKDILRRTKAAKSGSPEENQSNSSATSNIDDDTEILANEAAKPWLLGNLVDEANSYGVVQNRHIFNLFANTPIYVFFRHLNTLYERLSEVKVIDKEVTNEIQTRTVVQFAKDLNLLSTQLTDMGLDFKGTKAYNELLKLSKRLITGDLDHQWFEESLRQAYKNKAFKMYTVDKVVQSLVKHAHSIITDPKNAMLMTLFEQDRFKKDTTAKDQILYRLKVRNIIGEAENMFRIEYNTETAGVCIQYVAVDDLTLKEPQSMKDKWNYYVTSYSLSHPTEGIAQDEINQPFLEKIIEREAAFIDHDDVNEKFSPEGLSTSKLKVKINPETYQLSFEPGSTDVFTRKSVNKFPNNQDTARSSGIIKFLTGSQGWKKGLPEDIVEHVVSKERALKEQGKLVIDEKQPIATKPESVSEIPSNDSSTVDQT